MSEPTSTEQSMRDYLKDLEADYAQMGQRIAELKNTYPEILEIFTTEQLLTLEFPEPRWLIQGILPTDGHSMLVGQWGSWKTWLATDAGISIAAGRPFLDRDTSEGRVLILAMEGGQREHCRRVEALTRGISGAASLPVFHFASGSLDFDNEKQRAMIGAALRQVRPDLVIVDNLRLAFGGDENDSEQSRTIKQFTDGMATHHPASWLYIHHPIKSTAGVAKGNQVRGSGGIPSNLESLLMVEVTDQETGTLEHVKARYGKKVEPMAFKFHGPESPDGARFEYLGIPSERKPAGAIDDAILAALATEASGALLRGCLCDALRSDFSPKQVDRAVERMEAAGKVKRERVGREVAVRLLEGGAK